MKKYLQDRIGKVDLRIAEDGTTVGADIRVVLSSGGVQWAIMGTKNGSLAGSSSQDSPTRDQCDTRDLVHDWLDALMDRIEAEHLWRNK